MTKQVTATFTVVVRGMWHVGAALPATKGDGAKWEIRDEDNALIAHVHSLADANSIVTDHNRTTRIRAKQRAHRKADAKSGHQDHAEGDDQD